MTQDTTSIFGSESNTQAPPANAGTGNPGTQHQDDLGTLLAEIKNERGEQKYKSPKDALEALRHSQAYIPELSQKLKQQELELAEARAAAAKAAELEKLVLTFTQERTNNDLPVHKGLTEEDVAKLVSQTLTQRQQTEMAESNQQAVVDVVKKAFGDKAEQEFYSKAQESGMSVQEMNELARKNPKLVFKILGIDNKTVVQPTFKPTTSDFNTNGFEQKSESFVTRNSKPATIGATTRELQQEGFNSRKMVEELEAQGKSISDLTKPSEFYKYFGKK